MLFECLQKESYHSIFQHYQLHENFNFLFEKVMKNNYYNSLYMRTQKTIFWDVVCRYMIKILKNVGG